MQVTRVVTTSDGAGRAVPLDLDAWAREVEPLARALAPAESLDPSVPPRPEIVAGVGVFHLMMQVGACRGYEKEPIAADLTRVGGAWDLGYHATSGLSAAGPSVDLSRAEEIPEGSFAEDLTLTGVGRVTIEEDFLVLFGSCFLTVGTMQGGGVFWFDAPEGPAPPVG